MIHRFSNSILRLIIGACFLLITPTAVYANPIDGIVAGGEASIVTGATSVEIFQTTDKAIIDWRSFNIEANESTKFYQPSSSSFTLNRINDINPSTIRGSLTANGNIVLVNPNGVFFSSTAAVDVSGLVATTANITNNNFMSGNMVFDIKGNSSASIINEGVITARGAGLVGLVSPNVINNGVITANLGKVSLASGDSFTVDFYGDGLLNIGLSDDVTSQIVSNTGTIEASTIVMTATEGNNIVNSLIQVEGELKAPVAIEQNGKIIISGNTKTSAIITGKVKAKEVKVKARYIDNTGTIEGSKVDVTAHNISQQGKIIGDDVTVNFTGKYIDNEQSSITAKNISVLGAAGSGANISGNYNANSETAKGGTINITASDVKLFGAQITADGTEGGIINIGGEFQGTGTLLHAKTTDVNFSTVISAKGTAGDGGQVIVWSDDLTRVGGKIIATGSIDGGLVEISSKDKAYVSDYAVINASSTGTGANGQLLLDPKNIIIADAGTVSAIDYFELVDPNVGTDNNFGSSIVTLENGNLVVTASTDDFAATDAGAVYLYNGTTGTLISTLRGSTASDKIGTASTGGKFLGDSVSITKVGTSNFIIGSSSWDNGAIADAGAVTWVSGTTGVSGVISSSNSLVGSKASDKVGIYKLVLTNGNYVVTTPTWDNGAIVDAGAVTWGSGTTGVKGVISSANSLVGSTASDKIGITAPTNIVSSSDFVNVRALTNGNYVVSSTYWDNGLTAEAGAATWGNGNGGTVGVISSANSLVGSSEGDKVGMSIEALTNGNYIVGSYNWDNGAVLNAGAATWGSGTAGVKGVISSANSLVGSTESDLVGTSIIALTNGNYVVGSSYWNNGATLNVGAVTWGDGTTGVKGVVSAANSLIGSTASDCIGSTVVPGGKQFNISPAIVALSNGSYVVQSKYWDNGAATNAGAATWGSGTAGVKGVISAVNSLVGTTASDYVGRSVVVLTNGNYVVGSSGWNGVGAATWGSGTVGVKGTISVANSLVGSASSDNIGDNIIALTNGNYVVASSFWDNGAITGAGAVTWGNGTTGVKGTISAANSLVGSTANDEVGQSVTALTNGNYVVSSRNWNNGAIGDVGAVTWGNGNGGTVGAVSAANSLVGNLYDQIGDSITALTNGNYVVSSIYWDNGVIANAGAATWGNGTGGTVGAVSADNSLVGTNVGDQAGEYIKALANGNYVVGVYNWDNGAIANAGAATWGNGNGGTVGAVSALNSLVGSTVNDYVGNEIITLTNGNYIVKSVNWDNGAIANAGAATWGNGNGGTVGAVSAVNSLVGLTDLAAGNGITIKEDTINGNFYSSFLMVKKLYGASSSNPYLQTTYGYKPSDTKTLSPLFLKATLDAGTNLVLQASNDITVNNDIIVNNAGGNGGNLTMQAGRSILLNADITTDNGNLNLYANETLASGVVDAQRDAGAAVITMAAGAAINAGTGAVDIQIKAGTGLTNNTSGDITLRDITAGSVFVRNNKNTGDIVIASGVITGTNAGDAITLVSAKNFVNNAGAGALVASNGRWLSYSTTPANDTTGALVNNFRRYSCTYGGSCPALAAGNGFLYTITPVLTASGAASTTYGDAANLTGYAYALTGYLGADNLADTVTGSLNGTTTYAQGNNVGSYNINYSAGSLASAMGYGFTYANNAAGLTVNKRALTATVQNNTVTYGIATPTAIATFGNFYGADTVATVTGVDYSYGGAVAGSNNNAGSYSLGVSSIASTNYTIGAVTTGTLTINPYALTVTANAATKTYGSADNLTYTNTALVNGDTSAVFSGALARAAGNNVGTYAINQGTVTAGSNYTISYVGNNLVINPYALTVTANAATKTYGSADNLTYTNTALVNGDTSAVFSGALTRTAGNNVGTYVINQGTVSAGSNYTISYVGNNLVINPYALTVTANAATKTYGSVDPALSYTNTALVNGDDASVFSGSLTRAVGNNVGTYAINQGTVTAGSNYTISYVGNNLVINPYALTVTANAATKAYGSVDPALSYTNAALVNGDDASVFSGSLARAAGSNVGTYAINQGTVTAGSNYTISYVGNNLVINPYALTVTANAATKTYGSADNLTYTNTALVNGDTSAVFSGSLARAVGENVGGYAINQGTVTAGSNYTITYNSANLTINPYALTVTANAATKTYGSADNLTYTNTALVNGDTSAVFSGALTSAGQNVGIHTINQGTLTAGANYTVSYNGANLTINPYALTVTADVMGKIYRSVDPVLTYSYGLVNGDNASVFSGALTRAVGEDLGVYGVVQGTLAVTSNYTLSFVGNDFTIRKLVLPDTVASTVAPVAPQPLTPSYDESGENVEVAENLNGFEYIRYAQTDDDDEYKNSDESLEYRGRNNESEKSRILALKNRIKYLGLIELSPDLRKLLDGGI